MFIFIRGYAATLPATARSTGAATLLRSYTTCDGACGEMRDENQTTFRKNGFRNGVIEGPFDQGKVLKEQEHFQRRS
jgi:hypothetical protein